MPELPRAELADHRPPPPVRQALRHVLGGGTQVMAALLAIVLGVAIHLAHKHATYAGHSTGRVIAHETTGVRAYHVQVRYRDAAGAEHTGWIDLRGSLADSYPVDYDPAQPDRVIWHQPWYTNTVLVIVLLAFGSAAFMGTVFAMLVGVQRFRAIQRGEKTERLSRKPVIPLLVIPAICVALAVVLVRALSG